ELAHKNTPAAAKSEQPNNELAHKNTPAAAKSEQPNNELAHKNTLTTAKSEQPNNELAHKNTPAAAKSEQPRIRLSQKQKDIRNYCSVPRTAKEIMDRLGLSNYYNNRKRYIYYLVEAGILERTIPDKPNDPNQKYRRKL
ncbi:MAG: AAA family ATPase, partial [Muribaculum sp.]|nr:AAA family ATPase [Muribaculum sp.]